MTAQDLAPLDHVRMQAAAQPWVDSSISKTINVPADIGFEAFKDVYLEAYETGCKGCTTYRPERRHGERSVGRGEAQGVRVAGGVSPLPLVSNIPGEAPKAGGGRSPRPQMGRPHSDVIYMSECRWTGRNRLKGITYKLKWPDSDHALYITINEYHPARPTRRPFEIFIKLQETWSISQLDGGADADDLGGVPARRRNVSFVVEELKAVFDPRGAEKHPWRNGKYVPSIPRGHRRRDRAAHLIFIGFIRRGGDGPQDGPAGGGREPRPTGGVRPARPAGNTTCG